jgi:hypothetical protein
MVNMGLLAHIGAHGEPPLGLNYHAEMFFTKQGGLSNYEVRFFLLVSFSCSPSIYLGKGSPSGHYLWSYYLVNEFVPRFALPR